MADRFNEDKPPISLIHLLALEGASKVMKFGSKKHCKYNWLSDGGFKWTEVFDSLQRHLIAWQNGDDNDEETGLLHIDHALCNLLFLCYYNNPKAKVHGEDDRFKLFENDNLNDEKSNIEEILKYCNIMESDPLPQPDFHLRIMKKDRLLSSDM